jgi:chromosome segregation protein
VHLKKLSLCGFKSFPDSTDVEFVPGMTGIVGPNGCGKTNILDALRWVLGEQRSSALRSGKMDEVIFNGSRDAKPLGMSEVSLTIANSRGVLPTEYTDLTVTRRLYRSGESEYRLNKQPCRLRDILDLFADTGMGAHSYSVIQQDMIEAVLSEKAEERRFLFDEAAGITKYKHRKRAALRKLDATEADLLRLRDIAAEVRTRVNSLKRQSNKARRYNEIRERWRRLHLRLAYSDYQSLRDRVRTQSTRAENLRADLEAARARLTTREAQRDALQAQAEEAEAGTEQLRQGVGECENRLHELTTAAEKAGTQNQALEARQAEWVAELEVLARTRRERERQILELSAALAAAEEEAARADQQAREREEHRNRADSAWRSARTVQTQAQEQAEAARARSRQLETELVHAETSLVSLCESLAQAETAARNAEEDARGAQHERVDREAEETDAREAVEAADRALKQARTERQTAQEEAQKLEDAAARAERAQTELESEKQVLSSWMETYRGYHGAVPDLLTREPVRGIVDTVAEIIRPREGYELAVAAALAERAEYLVCTDREAAQAVLRRLEASDAGRATVVVMDALAPAEPPAPPRPGARPLVELARVAGEYEPLKTFLLGDFFYWDGEEPDTRGLPSTAALVTAVGTVYRGTAEASAGKPSAANLLARKDELERLQQRLDAQAQVVHEAQERLRAASLRFESMGDRVAQLEESLATSGERYRGTSLEAERARARSESAARDLQRCQQGHVSLVERVEASRSELVNLKSARERAETEYRSVQSVLQQSGSAFDQAEKQRTDAILRSGEAQVQTVSLKARVEGIASDRDRTREMLAETQARIASAVQQLLEAGTKRRETAVRLEQTAAERARLELLRAEREGAYGRAREAARDLLTQVQETDRELKTARKAADEISANHHDAEMATSEARLEVSGLCERIREHLDVDLSSCTDLEPVDTAERGLLTAEQQELKERLDRMGTVNLLALEEYEEQKARLDFLDHQLADTETAKKNLEDTIVKINTVARSLFVDTFTRVQQNFNELFGQLFEGGEANVSLDQPDDPLESAIAITARPRGKRPVSILQLSGGERALTSIALLFSLYMVKPSPFCILDEIDAPLDDANIVRFLTLLQRFSADTQFIIITHNKMTMQATDVLYGVTMERPGISKVVSVRLNEAIEVAGVS